MQPTRFLLVSSLVLLGWFAGCSKREQSAVDAKPKVPAVQEVAKPVTALTDAQREELQELGAKLENLIQDADIPGFKALFDQEAMLQEATSGLELSGKALETFKKGMQAGVGKGLGGMVENWSKADQIKLKGVVITQGQPAVRFRFIQEDGGIAFVDFIARPSKDGKLTLVNICNQSFSYDMLAQCRQSMVPFLADLDRSLIQRMLNRPQLTSVELKNFTEFAKSRANGDYQACIKLWPTLAEPIRNMFSFRVVYAEMLNKVGDTAGYHKALKETADQFKGANLDFMLVDVHFLDKEYGKALQCLDNFIKVIGQDAALLSLKGSILLAQEDKVAARACLLEALKVEPDCVYAHECALDILLAARDFKGVRDSMVFLEANAEYEFKDAMTDDIWKEFLQSPESARWR